MKLLTKKLTAMKKLVKLFAAGLMIFMTANSFAQTKVATAGPITKGSAHPELNKVKDNFPGLFNYLQSQSATYKAHGITPAQIEKRVDANMKHGFRKADNTNRPTSERRAVLEQRVTSAKMMQHHAAMINRMQTNRVRRR